MTGSSEVDGPWRRVDVFVVDRNDKPLPGAEIAYRVDGEDVGGVSDAEGRGSIEVPNSGVQIEITSSYLGASQHVKIAPDQKNWTFRFDVEIDRAVRITVRDRQGSPIPGASVTIMGDGNDKTLITDTAGVATSTIHDPRVNARVLAQYKDQRKEEPLGPMESQAIVSLPIRYVSPAGHRTRFAILVFVTFLALAALFGYFGGMENHLPLIVGLVLAACAIILAFVFTNATPLQRQIILTLAALAGGAIATEIPGFLSVQLTLSEKTGVAAGGAIAVFVILYFWSAAKPPD
jgi:hypothetical protein